jgi:hypothetical protein
MRAGCARPTSIKTPPSPPSEGRREAWMARRAESSVLNSMKAHAFCKCATTPGQWMRDSTGEESATYAANNVNLLEGAKAGAEDVAKCLLRNGLNDALDETRRSGDGESGFAEGRTGGHRSSSRGGSALSDRGGRLRREPSATQWSERARRKTHRSGGRNALVLLRDLAPLGGVAGSEAGPGLGSGGRSRSRRSGSG